MNSFMRRMAMAALMRAGLTGDSAKSLMERVQPMFRRKAVKRMAKYMPHNGEREMARRRRQMELKRHPLTPYT